MNNFKTIFLDILNAINYSNNKEAFTAKFIKYIELKSLQGLIQALPSNIQEEIKSQLPAVSDDPQKVSEMLKSYFSDDQIQQSLQNVTKDAIFNYLTTVSKTLSDAQRENLMRTLEKYSSSQPTPSNL